MNLEEQADQLVVSLQHHRINPLEFRISYSQLADFLEDAEQLETLPARGDHLPPALMSAN